jgi:hypothetical protein
MVTNILQLFTGFADRRTIKVESAMCGGGICVYLASLKNPTTTPQEQLRAIVVAGQIERNGAIYEAVADKPVHPRNNIFWTSYKPSDFLRVYGRSPTLELIVEETPVSSVLDAYISVTRSTPHKGFSLKFHPGHDDGAPQNSIRDTPRLSPGDIRCRILDTALKHPRVPQIIQTCAFSVLEKRVVTWTGRCSEVATTLWTACNFPAPGDWILVPMLHFDDCCQEVLFGSYALYYAIICSRQAADSRLTTASCLMCTFTFSTKLVPDNKGNCRILLVKLPQFKLGQVTLFSSRGSELYSIELIREAKLASDSPPPTDSTDT